LVFIEASGFTKHLREYLSDDEYGLLQKALVENPAMGALIRGSGGVRKVRWAAGGKGKSGGVRVIYYWVGAKDHIHLLVIYGKGEKDNLTPADLKRIKVLLEEIENG
jgi:mRNA-degrading endonuclease RelE of RelBE toxin-antitoxin system